MKRKCADRPDWLRILEKEYKQLYVNDDSYRGYITYLHLRKVREPLLVTYDTKDICIVDDGFKWLMYFPQESGYSVTTTFDSHGNIVQWYFDIIKNQGLTNEGIPYIDDLYLDLVLLPDGTLYVLDEDELGEALDAKEISKHDFDNANVILSDLIESIKSHTNYEIKDCKRRFELMNTL
ncbi:hypothetical protein SAMN03159341_11988 [Paenibacillus sp. 1_12]|uniref:DUF402 domain-containing protein n=1 Tax=Paenibacillus sp. 1_12 TaxID=1566278 RepID=UPI0008E2DB3F|nr:DUF402 domain-containing protein [Paenibacillus sp. 1_12]SFM18499.1 hypothetical protein SAMN03159341_11988 [Paenibacillus sp. 1_12]